MLPPSPPSPKSTIVDNKMNPNDVSQPSDCSASYFWGDAQYLTRRFSVPTITSTAFSGFNPTPIRQGTEPSFPSHHASGPPFYLSSPPFCQQSAWPASVSLTSPDLYTYDWQMQPIVPQPPPTNATLLSPTNLALLSPTNVNHLSLMSVPQMGIGAIVEQAPVPKRKRGPLAQPSNAAGDTPEKPVKKRSKPVPKVNRYVCRSCEKTFARPSALLTHTHSHTGARPFVCSMYGCGKAFSTSSNRKRHEMIHFDPRPRKSRQNGNAVEAVHPFYFL
ncbi:hypothetical protein GGI03_001129 [Coemansia sp. RSA 2337]|nr:hypothetical protein GGI03_001129 [Coemansia sp. RSA 2337]